MKSKEQIEAAIAVMDTAFEMAPSLHSVGILTALKWASRGNESFDEMLCALAAVAERNVEIVGAE